MDQNPTSRRLAAQTSNDDLNRTVDQWQESPGARGTPVAYRRAPAPEHVTASFIRTATRSEHSGEPAPLWGQPTVTEGINAAMNSVETPRKHPPAYRVLAYSVFSQLSGRDHTMLPLGDSDD